MSTELTPRKAITKASLGGMKFLYNPNAIQDTDSIVYNDLKTAGMSYPLMTYGGGDRRIISFDVYLNDKVQDGITKKFIDNLRTFLPKPRSKGYQFESPSSIQFAFGWLVVDCYLYNMQVNYSAFSPTLQPIEATINISLAVIQ
jgi:hypothetical protein